jgi:hypothetical protein
LSRGCPWALQKWHEEGGGIVQFQWLGYGKIEQIVIWTQSSSTNSLESVQTHCLHG